MPKPAPASRLRGAKPCFKARHVESSYPGYLLCQDTVYVGRLKGIGRIYLQAVIDTYGSFGFAKLYTSKRQETAADILHDQLLPFYQRFEMGKKERARIMKKAA